MEFQLIFLFWLNWRKQQEVKYVLISHVRLPKQSVTMKKYLLWGYTLNIVMSDASILV